MFEHGHSSSHDLNLARIAPVTSENVVIDSMTPKDEKCLRELIRRNISGYQEAGSVIASSLRRLENFGDIYRAEGSVFLVARDESHEGLCVGGAGIGPLHGLAPAEGLGEVRDLVVDQECRGQGIGARIIKRCLEEAKKMGYHKLYLETTPQMEDAQKLFLRYGFRPITQGSQPFSKGEPLPCYFILNIADDSRS